MSEMFQVQFEGKTVKRKFYTIPSEKISEFQSALGFLPPEFLTFDGGTTYKICAQYAPTKSRQEQSYLGVVTRLPEEPANLVVGIDSNGYNGIISPYQYLFVEFDNYFSDYGYIFDICSEYVDEFSFVYVVTKYWDYSKDESVYDTRFIRKLCEDYFWSYSLSFDNIKLHQTQTSTL